MSLLLLLPLGCNYTGPPCEHIQLSALEVEVGEDIQIHWEGDQPNFLEVLDADDVALWEVHCPCTLEEAFPDRNSGCTNLDRDMRQCLESPVVYGQVPDYATFSDEDGAFQLEPLPLESGQVYKVQIGSYCAQGRVGEIAGFTAP